MTQASTTSMQAERAHTAGPWEALRGVLKGDHILIRGGDYGIAKVYDEEDGMTGVNEANACLIAAAPDLLAAVSNIVSRLGATEENDGHKEIWRAAFDAIAKARGEA